MRSGIEIWLATEIGSYIKTDEVLVEWQGVVLHSNSSTNHPADKIKVTIGEFWQVNEYPINSPESDLIALIKKRAGQIVANYYESLSEFGK